MPGNCLFVVDLQQGFLEKETVALPGKVARLLSSHAFDDTIFFLFFNQKGTPFDTLLKWERMRSKKDIALAKELEAFSPKFFVHTTYGLFSKELLDSLRKKEVKRVFLSGVYTDVSLYKSLLDAFDLGFEPFLIEDLCATPHGKASHRAFVESAKRAIGAGRVVKSKDLPGLLV